MSAEVSSDKAKKYDRQLRLWGDHGQACLGSATILLLGAGASGCETLKNLVLPGVQGFTVAADGNVTEADAHSNFFLPAASAGKARAETAAAMLSELNDMVSAAHLEESVDEVIRRGGAYLSRFACVVACNLADHLFAPLSALCEASSVPVVVVRSYGLVGSVRVWAPEHHVVESKPEFSLQDLRVANPFPELQKLADSIDLEPEDSQEHAHVPWVLLLVGHLKRWREAHGGANPATYAEKKEFVAQVVARSHDPEKEGNYREARDNAMKSLNVFALPSAAQAVVTSRATEPAALTPTTPLFYVIASAVREFIERHKVPPLAGHVPDMTATTDQFVALQHAYHTRAEADLAEVMSAVQRTLARLGRSEAEASLDEVRLACRNVANWKVLTYEPVCAPDTVFGLSGARLSQQKDGAQAMGDEHLAHNINWVVLFRAADRFLRSQGRFPGVHAEAMEADFATLRGMTTAVLADLGLPPNFVDDDAVKEFVRFGGAEIHNIASVVGGIASQEIIKIITKQYTPINHTVIYDGIHCTTATF
jgi:amyloid beta precursor protein binding protein 1